MARYYRNGSSRGARNLSSAVWDTLESTARTANKAAVGATRWATTDHFGAGRSFLDMPSLGFVDTLQYVFVLILSQAVCAVVYAGLIFLFIAFGVPLLISLIFG
jgi:hypothetical protein